MLSLNAVQTRPQSWSFLSDPYWYLRFPWTRYISQIHQNRKPTISDVLPSSLILSSSLSISNRKKDAVAIVLLYCESKTLPTWKKNLLQWFSFNLLLLWWNLIVINCYYCAFCLPDTFHYQCLVCSIVRVVMLLLQKKKKQQKTCRFKMQCQVHQEDIVKQITR